MGFNGTDAALAGLKKLREQFPDKVAAALYQEAQVEAKECKRLCPVDTGALRASIHVEGPFRDGRAISAKIVAGDASIDYALVVHEDLEAIHKNGEAKFIERPLDESAPYMPARLAARIELNAK